MTKKQEKTEKKQEKTPENKKKGVILRAKKEETARRIDIVHQLRMKGKGRWEIFQYVKRENEKPVKDEEGNIIKPGYTRPWYDPEPWPIQSVQAIDDLIGKDRKRQKERVEDYFTEEFNKARDRLELIFTQAYAAADMPRAIEAVKATCALMGLNQPTRIESKVDMTANLSMSDIMASIKESEKVEEPDYRRKK